MFLTAAIIPSMCGSSVRDLADAMMAEFKRQIADKAGR
jgi:hypothetical protein